MKKFMYLLFFKIYYGEYSRTTSYNTTCEDIKVLGNGDLNSQTTSQERSEIDLILITP